MTTENNVTQIREADNEVTIDGLLVELKSFEGGTGESEYLSATLTVEVADNEQVSISMYAKKSSGLYKSLRTVVDDYKPVAKVGREEADHVRVEKSNNPDFKNGIIRRNDYVGGDGQLRSFPEISATFVNRIEDMSTYNPHAKFSVEVIVDKITDEFDKEENETGRVSLHGYIPLYGGRVIPMEFKVNEDGSGYVQGNYEKNDTVYVYGDIINKSEKTVKKIEAAFGADKEEVKYNTVREYLITGGGEPCDEDDPKSFDPKAVAKALTEREVFLEGKKADHEKKGKSGGRQGGFDTNKTKTKKREVGDDLPF